MLSVHNEGEPIPPDQMESIFQLFVRAEAAKEGNKEGWGIGLPYVRSVAESHGGSVTVDSAAPRGTTFMMDIPRDARPFQDAPILGEIRREEAALSARSSGSQNPAGRFDPATWGLVIWRLAEARWTTISFHGEFRPRRSGPCGHRACA